MRIAIAGKGGAGKTTISATLARHLARSGMTVVAVDADSNPNLAVALGVPRDEATGASALPASIVSRRLQGPALKDPVEVILNDHAVVAPDGVRVVMMGMPGHAEEGCLCAAHATVSAVLADLGERPDVATIIDLEASPEHASRGTTRNADVLVLVTEPYFRSLEAARRLAVLATELPIPRVGVIANKVRRPDEGEAVAEFCARHGLELLGEVPWSDTVLDADVSGVALIERGGDAVAAVAAIAERLLGPAPETVAASAGRA